MTSGEDDDELRRSVATPKAEATRSRQVAPQKLASARQSLDVRAEELARSLSMARATLQALSVGILVIDGEGRVTDFNDTFTAMWRIPPERLRRSEHRAVVDLMAQEIAHQDAIQDGPDTLELKDGRVFERASRALVVDGRPVGRVWSFRDITARRRSQSAAGAEAERARDLEDEFLANLSHELRTPLNVILGWAQVLLRRPGDYAESRKGLEAIERNARAQAQLIRDLVDLNRIASGKVRLDMRPAAPAAFIEAAIEMITPAAVAKDIRLEKRLDAAAGAVFGDSARLQQVVWNLLANAIESTPPAGRVDIVLERVRGHIEITVADTGIGIDAARLGSMLERFGQVGDPPTRRPAGLGLGLAIVEQLVQLHGGTVRVSSVGEGHGAAFVVRLPVMASGAELAASASAPSKSTVARPGGPTRPGRGS
jgi:signal transduction histidine kinase